jgi:hypothetical protein
MELNEEPPPALAEQPMPDTVRLVGLVLRVQAVCYLAAAPIAAGFYLLRGASTLELGAYATGRTHPLTMFAVGLGAGGLLLWLARRLTARRIGLLRLIAVTEAVLLADAVLAFLLGVFNLWSVAGLLAAVAANWLIRQEDTSRYLG